MKKIYEAPAMKIAIVHNEDVLTASAGNYEGFNLEGNQSAVKNIYDFSVFGE